MHASKKEEYRRRLDSATDANRENETLRNACFLPCVVVERMSYVPSIAIFHLSL